MRTGTRLLTEATGTSLPMEAVAVGAAVGAGAGAGGVVW
jgi:hypothetical protein